MDYEELYSQLLLKTNNFGNSAGEHDADDVYEAKMAASILKQYYDSVDIDESQGRFIVTYSNGEVEESYKDLEFQPDKGAGIDKFNGMLGEGLSYSDNELKDLGFTKELIQTFKNHRHSKPKMVTSIFDDLSMADGMVGAITEAQEYHKELNDSLWENNKLKPEVRDKLLEIVDIFKLNLLEDDIDLDVKDILLVGSNASYNYNDKSDIDCHIIADFSSISDDTDLVDKLYQAKKTLWNDKYEPLIYGHEVEVFVEPYKGEEQ